MKIAKLECRNFAGVPDGAYSFLAPGRTTPHALTLVAGVRGSGKTRLLEAIVTLKELVGPYRAAPPLASLLEPFAARAAARYTWSPEGFTDAERAFGEAAWRRAVVACAASPAIEKVGKLDRKAVAKAMHGMKISAAQYPGVIMDVSIDDKGDLDRASFLVEARGGKQEIKEILPALGK